MYQELERLALNVYLNMNLLRYHHPCSMTMCQSEKQLNQTWQNNLKEKSKTTIVPFLKTIKTAYFIDDMPLIQALNDSMFKTFNDLDELVVKKLVKINSQ